MKTLRDFIDEDGYLDVDVYDTELDMGVAFVYSIYDPKDQYGRFLESFLDVEVTHDSRETGWGLTCDFSGFFRPHNSELVEFYDLFLKGTGREFSKGEMYYNFVTWLEGWVSGYATPSTYEMLANLMENW